MAPRTECITCQRKVQTASLPRVPKASGCTHERQTCRKCWHEWLKSQVASASANKISCIQCSNILVQSDIQKLATVSTYKAYEDASLKSVLSQDPDFRWCFATDCKSGQIHDGGDIFTCSSCGYKACVHCNVAWHSEETCETYTGRVQAQNLNEASSARTLQKVAKLCPNCSRKLQKNGGCDHMTCQLCRHEFCWICLVDYAGIRREGNSHHKSNCQHYRAIIVPELGIADDDV
ncbi:hypothetical protein DOTSEDRAFT_74442 [Dothistroma septosporum NZE10]|uniref:RBR-type E3 ubiquitin transferase n=1 Tax=Dothistroma septosporum (strain NZE10 / CBS 128990) TaxID=675120 RepID=N1PEU1_DOTSN|nr:hypothetical protein DOTSEDRAFT_74442 [Dothistroma septosporum NZE10]